MTEIHIVPALRDNYIYILRSGNQTAAVDPSEAAPVLKFLKDRAWGLDFIWNTHHHYDHTGGNLELKRVYDCRICGFEEDRPRLPGLDRGLSDGERVLLGETEAKALFIPGHTLGHIAFYFPREKRLFCGDTLFGLGCGRIFEGTAQDMFESLGKLKKLPEETLIYCGHEYTEANGKFVLSLKKQITEKPLFPPASKAGRGGEAGKIFLTEKNYGAAFWDALEERMKKVRSARAQNRPTVPFTLKEEAAANPFLRACNAEELAELRKQKNNFS